MTSDLIQVLHVDDNPDTADLTAEFLERENDRLNVVIETNADDALDYLADNHEAIDCIISDYDMPHIDGLEFLESVRETCPNIPFILYTGKGGEEVASEAISAGVTDYLQKETGTEQYKILANRVENAVTQYQAEQEAAETKRQLRELSQATNDALWMFTADWGELCYINSAYEDIWGRSTETLAENAQDFLNGIHPDDHDRVKDAMDRLSSGESVEIEYRVNAAEDFQRWVWVQGEPIVNDDDDVVRVAGFARDITDRKQKQEELERKTRAMDAAPVGILITDPSQEDNPIIYVNDGFQRLTGYEEDEILGRNCRFLQGENTAPEPVAEMREAVDNEDPVSVELRNYRKDDTEFWNHVSIAPVTNDVGETTYFVGFQQDITDRKQREQELYEEREWRTAIFDGSRDAIFISDRDASFVDVNQAAAELTGYDRDELLSMEITDLHEDADLDAYREYHDRILAGEPATTEAQLLRGDGSKIPVEFSNQRIEVDNEVYMHTVARDISERKERERELERQNERLEEFARIVSHDLRNPLNVAQGQLKLVRDESDDSRLEAVARAHTRMERLIDDLLTLARQGKTVSETEIVDLADLIEACWHNVATADAQLVVDTEQTIRADKSRFQQLVENLLRNAVEHGGDDVTITVGTLTDGFYIEDDGPGIPEDKRSHAFDSGYSTGDNGTGFGLAIVKQIVEAHGWDIAVTKSSEGGARFEITGIET